jgi:hypothetical protein
MIIETKYNVGHVFWVPRVSEVSSHETIVVNGEEYSRVEKTLVPFARKKRVALINASYSDFEGHKVRYCAVNFDERDSDVWKLGGYIETELRFTEEAEALEFANWWKNTYGEEYFGESR